jgi:phosphoglycolate phosphatase
MMRAVTFDLDGTLIDSTEPIVTSFQHTFRAIGETPPSRDVITGSIGYTLHEQFSRLTLHDANDCVRIYREHYQTIMCDQTFLLPGAQRTLERLRDAGIRLGFATSKKREYSEQILEHLGVLEFFTCRLGPDDVTHPKPHPEAVLRSLEELGVQPHEMFFVGDTRFDVHAAQAAGVRCLAVATGYASRDELVRLRPEAVFDGLTELSDYVLAQRDGFSPSED